MGAPVPSSSPLKRRRSPSKRLATRPASAPMPIPTLTSPPNSIRSDIWFADGNVVLITAPSSSSQRGHEHGVAFKVHRGQLARHSEVFYDLFSLPQPAEAEQMLYDGCPWIEVFDAPGDIRCFLRALYDGLYFPSPSAHDFPVLASVLRLSTKYLVDHLRQRCMSRLALDFPFSLGGWDSREMAATSMDGSGQYTPRALYAHPILMLTFVLEMGVELEGMLGAAMYDLARYGPSKIVGGVEVVDEGVLDDSGNPTRTHHNLPPSLLLAVLRGREAAQHFLSSFIVRELQNRAPARDCLHQGTAAERLCRESFYFIMLNLLRAVGGIACGRDADPLFSLLQAVEMLSRTDFQVASSADSHDDTASTSTGLKLCERCKVDFARAAARAREECWAMVTGGGWFGV